MFFTVVQDLRGCPMTCSAGRENSLERIVVHRGNFAMPKTAEIQSADIESQEAEILPLDHGCHCGVIVRYTQQIKFSADLCHHVYNCA